MMFFWPGAHMGGWGWVMAAAGMVVFWAVLLTLAVLLVRDLGASSRDVPRPRPTAEEILAERFARGEIDEDEYRRRLETLVPSRGGTGAR